MALGLLAPLNLLAGLAVVVPIAVHLLQRKREATVDFPAVRFLLLAQRRSSRRVRVRRLLLLLVRCLAVLLFALLLARPVLQAPGAAFREGEPGFTAVILDTSLSMTALAADSRPRFEAARDLARKIAAPAGAREQFALVAAAPRPGEVAAAPRWLDADGFARAVGAAAARPAVVEPARAFAEAYRLLRETGAAQRRIIVISDFARGGWDRASLGALPLFDASVPVRLLRLGGDGARNRAGIVRVEAHGESRVAGEPRVVRAEIVNAGPEQVLPVEFWLDDKLAASRLETVPPGTSAAVEFTLRPASAGAQRVEVRLPPDRYPADDRRLLGIDVAAPVNVLAIDGEPGASLTQSETFFLQEALRPERMALTAPVRVAIAGPEMPVDPVPAGTAVVIAANVRAPGEKAGTVLADYVAAGGSLLVFWGGPATPRPGGGRCPGCCRRRWQGPRWRRRSGRGGSARSITRRRRSPSFARRRTGRLQPPRSRCGRGSNRRRRPPASWPALKTGRPGWSSTGWGAGASCSALRRRTSKATTWRRGRCTCPWCSVSCSGSPTASRRRRMSSTSSANRSSSRAQRSSQAPKSTSSLPAASIAPPSFASRPPAASRPPGRRGRSGSTAGRVRDATGSPP